MFERNNSQKVYSSILFAYLDVTLFPLDIWSIKHKLNVWIGKTNACQYHINKSFINLSLDNFLKNQISQLCGQNRLYLIWKIIHSSHKITKESYWSFNTTKTLSVKSNLQNYKFWIGSAIQVLTSNLTLVMYPIRSV